jgi:Flp pilus assembly protein TadD
MEKVAAYHVSMGRLFSKTDQVPEAITEFQAAMRYDSSRDMQASMYNMIGDAQRRLGKPNESITSFRKAKEISGRANVLLAMMLGSRGDHDEALAEYREAVRQTPNLPGVLNSFAYAMAEWGENLDEALPAARRAVEMMPSSAEFVDTLGWVLFKKGMLLDAEYAFFDGLRLEGGNDPTLRSHLAAVMDARGDWSGDRRELRTLLEGELSARQLARMKELLRK